MTLLRGREWVGNEGILGKESRRDGSGCLGRDADEKKKKNTRIVFNGNSSPQFVVIC